MVLGSILKPLAELAKLSSNSYYIQNNGVDLLYNSFTEPKPLCKSPEEKKKAYDLLNKTLNNLDQSLVEYSGSLNVDKRQTAQKVRSSLQFLVDELSELDTDADKPDKKLKSIANWDSVKSIEDYLENSWYRA
jgi:hypothetical protein